MKTLTPKSNLYWSTDTLECKLQKKITKQWLHNLSIFYLNFEFLTLFQSNKNISYTHFWFLASSVDYVDPDLMASEETSYIYSALGTEYRF